MPSNPHSHIIQNAFSYGVTNCHAQQGREPHCLEFPNCHAQQGREPHCLEIRDSLAHALSNALSLTHELRYVITHCHVKQGREPLTLAHALAYALAHAHALAHALTHGLDHGH